MAPASVRPVNNASFGKQKPLLLYSYPADGKANVPAVEVLTDLPDLFEKMNKRLTELENQKQTGFVGRLFGSR